MTPRRYTSSEEGKPTPKLLRLTPTNSARLAATSKDTNISENAIVNAALAQYWSQAATASYTATDTSSPLLAANSLASFVTSSVDTYSETIASTSDSFENVVNKLSGKPEEEEPHA